MTVSLSRVTYRFQGEGVVSSPQAAIGPMQQSDCCTGTGGPQSV